MSGKYVAPWKFLLVIGLLIVAAPARARVFPARVGESMFNARVLRNIDEYDSHWGAGFGYCLAGRLSLDLEYRRDGILGRDLLALQGEVALIRSAGFALESGYHYTLYTSSYRRHHVIPVRFSFLFAVSGGFSLSPSLTAWHLPDDENEISFVFAGLDACWQNRMSIGLELNLNQDLRYHYLDIKVGYHW